MKHGERMLIYTLAASALCTVASAITGDAAGSPYQSVVERNVFGLKPPPPPPDPEANKPPPPKMFLQGITTFGGTKRALLKAQTPPKPGVPPKAEDSFVLAEGQRQGDIEVLEIDVQKGTVKVNDFGTVTTLDFEHDGIKTATAAPVPGVAPHPGGGFPVPGASPFTPAGGAPRLPITRPMRLPSPTGAAASIGSGGATPMYASGTQNLGVGGTAMPLYGSTPAPTQVQPQPAASQTSQLSAEEQFLMVEANRQRLQQMGLDTKFPPIPPTPLTPGFTPGTPTTGPTTPQPNLPPRAPGLPLLPPTS
jgi:hypothetical protein